MRFLLLIICSFCLPIILFSQNQSLSKEDKKKQDEKEKIEKKINKKEAEVSEIDKKKSKRQNELEVLKLKKSQLENIEETQSAPQNEEKIKTDQKIEENKNKDIKELSQKVDNLLDIIKKEKDIHLGLSVGFRQAFSTGKADKFLAQASISPIDSTLQIEHLNRYSLLISAVITVFPWENKKVKLRNWGGYANINLAEIASDGGFEGIFNQQIEGGIGISKRLSKNFSFGIGYEFIFHRRIRNHLFEFEGQKITKDGKVITDLDENDENIFRSDNVHAWSVKFIFFLGKNN